MQSNIKTTYIVTGANGHLGTAIIHKLSKLHAANDEMQILGFVLRGEVFTKVDGVTYIEGDVTDPNSLTQLFSLAKGKTYVIHTAGIVDISEFVSPAVYNVNVVGTANVIEMCEKFAVKRLVYVSSVHAIPEKSHEFVIDEVGSFSENDVVGGYAKTKAEASGLVLNAAAQGLDAVIVHPSGIIGPLDEAGNNHLVQMIDNFMSGKLSAIIDGGYDFVDVRDVADGCLRAATDGKRGECYILSCHYYKIKDILKMVNAIRPKHTFITLPHFIARLAVPFAKVIAKIKKTRPLFTKYSIHTVKTNSNFSYQKASKQLGYFPRDIYTSIKDTVEYLLSKRQKAKA